MTAYYNENDRSAAAWLRELIREGLISDGVVDERSICDVQPADLVGFTRCHFFAGIGGWDYALNLAGWPADRPVWTGSCPCQPFSSAGKRKGADDERDLWPDFFRLIDEARPLHVFGEQVASADVIGTELEASFLIAVQAGQFARANKIAKRLAASSNFHFAPRWITRIRADLDRADYALWWKVLGSHSAGAPNIRQRLWWVADAGPLTVRREGFKPASAATRDCQGEAWEQRVRPEFESVCCAGSGGMVDADCERRGEAGPSERRQRPAVGGAIRDDFWSAYELVYCRDEKYRRVEPGTFPLASGVSGRVGMLRGYGNAINPWVAKEFIAAYIEAKAELT